MKPYSIDMLRLEREQARAKAAKCWAVLDSIRPANASALIVAEYEEDESDIMSDHHGSRTTRRVAIGWRTGKREDFRQLRRAAAGYSPTAHLGPGLVGRSEYGHEIDIEHRDNYSMGRGNWIGLDRYSGWQVRSLDLDYSGYRDTAYVLWLPGLGVAVTAGRAA